ncbi:MAG TPA: type II/IV secretion system ATPase subunit, partial [Candidatus Nanoarchaeia archaeon]|nr:type II/IV secretion system ATPase subunit [Candidatus Nanoarchaeia archaeon]
AQKSGKYISYATPLLDGRLPDGTRVNATYTQDISSRGPTFTLRKFTKEPWSPVRLIQFRTVSPEILAYLWLLIENGSNIMIIGGTGEGKTSLLNSLAFFIPPQARIVSIEDTRELNLVHENWLPSVVREGIGIKGEEGEVDMFTLLKESFRQRPDYVIVGEIRGKEAYVLFQGAASGHSTMSTMHAEDVATMIRRLETKPIELSPSLVNTIDAVCVIGSIKSGDKHERRVKEIVEIVEVGERLGQVKLNYPFTWDPKTDSFFFKTESRILDRIEKKAGISRDVLNKEFNTRARLLMKLYQNSIFDFKKVQDVINAYYKDKEGVLRKYNLLDTR